MKKGSAVLFTAALLSVVYAGMALFLPAGAFFTADEGFRLLQIDALRPWPPGAVSQVSRYPALDPSGDFVPPGLRGNDTRAASTFPMMLPLVAGLPRLLFGVRGALLVPALAAILCMLMTARLAGFVLPSGLRGLAGVAAVVTTPLVVRGAILGEATLAALLVTAGLIPICKSAGAEDSTRPARPLRLAAVGGILLGLAGASSYAAFLVTPAVVVAGLLAWGVSRFGARALAVVAGSAAIAVPRALYHGAWIPALPAERPRFFGALSANVLPQTARPWFAGALLLLALLWLLRRRLAERIPAAVLPAAGAVLAAALLAAGPLFTVTATLTEAPLSAKERGLMSLLNLLPLLALLPLAVIPGRNPAPPHLKFLGGVVVFFTLIASAVIPGLSGPAWGPATLMPVAGLAAVVLMTMMVDRRESPGGRFVMIMLWLTLATGVAVQGAGLRFVASVRTYNAAVLERVESAVAEDGVILTDLPDIPLLLASLSPATPCLVVREGADIEELAGRIEEAGKTPFWVVRARSKGRFPRGSRLDLGAGLALLRHEAETGVRGFMRLPVGD